MSKLEFQLSKGKQDYYTCIILHMVLPLLPIGLEYLARGGTVAVTSLTLMASFYAISIGLSSKDIVLFAFSILLCVIFSALFGMVSVPNSSGPLSLTKIKIFAIGSMVVMFVAHAAERYRRHVIKEEDFWDWDYYKKNGGKVINE